MKHCLALVLCLVTGTAAADVTVVDNHQKLDVDCAKDPNVELVGNHISLTTKGVCNKISVTGNHATVTASAKTVFIAGNHNTVTIETDDVTIAGNNNTLTVRKWLSGKPHISNPGTDNVVTLPK